MVEARGIGEPSIVPTPAAIADPTGVRLHETPMNPERVWRALQDAGQAK